jgi:excisionase family DNA binding protein
LDNVVVVGALHRISCLTREKGIMSSTLLTREPVIARDDEQARIEQIRHLYEQREQLPPGTVKMVGTNGEEIELPDSVLSLLRQVVNLLASGEAVSIVPLHKELTTQQAADLLNISRQYLVRILDRGDIPYHKVGSHRRLAFGDVMDYKHRRNKERRRGLDELTQLSQELGLYDSTE